MADEEFTSKWDGLHESLIAKIYQVDRHGNAVKNTNFVQAPILSESGNLEVTMNWQSPFENNGGGQFSTLEAVLQSGSFLPVIDSILGYDLAKTAREAAEKSREFLKSVEGRTGVTKLNSTQVFNGMPPMKLNVSLLFRAWNDPVEEVEVPVNQLMAWALPQKLAADSTQLSRLIDAGQNGIGVDTFLPSQSPGLIGMRYKNKLYSPMVIESVGLSVTEPSTKSGHDVSKTVTLQLASLSGLDKTDWQNTNYRGSYYRQS